jgi:hypothetical protein
MNRFEPFAIRESRCWLQSHLHFHTMRRCGFEDQARTIGYKIGRERRDKRTGLGSVTGLQHSA